jgi:hypothetical protein
MDILKEFNASIFNTLVMVHENPRTSTGYWQVLGPNNSRFHPHVNSPLAGAIYM